MDNDNQDIPRLRIVHIISGDRWAGAEVQAYTLLSELAKSHDVFAIILNDGELANKLKDIGITVKIFDETHLSSVSLFFKIRSALYNIKPDVVHTHRQKENILGSFANKVSVRARCVRTVHGAPEFKVKGLQYIHVWLDRFCANHLQDVSIAVSEELKSTLQNTLGYSGKVIHVNNGLDPNEVTANLTIPAFKEGYPGYKHLGIVGRLEEVKRVDIFLAMAEHLLGKNSNKKLLFHVFGDGAKRELLENQAMQLEISKHICFHGHTQDIRSAINNLDVIIMCSDHEGLPMTALECLALKKPIVAHAVGGLIPLLSSYPDLLVHSHTPEAYANQVELVLSNLVSTEYPDSFHIQQTCKKTVNTYL